MTRTDISFVQFIRILVIALAALLMAFGGRVMTSSTIDFDHGRPAITRLQESAPAQSASAESLVRSPHDPCCGSTCAPPLCPTMADLQRPPFRLQVMPLAARLQSGLGAEGLRRPPKIAV